MKKKILSIFPLFFIIGVWILFSSPYFFKGRIPYASDYQVNFFQPWSHYEKFWGPVKNNAMPDVHGQMYPWKKFTIDTFKKGQIPLWNPYSFSGNPHLANYQSAVLSPLNLLFIILPFVDAWSILILLQPLLAGCFMYLLMRGAYKISNFAALFSSVAFMFCGFIVVWMAYGTLAYAIVYLPFGIYAIERYLQSKQIKFLFFLSFSIPLSFFSGHFQISFYFFGTLIFYVLFKIISEKNKSPFFFIVLAMLFGLAGAAFQIVPSLELYIHTVRSELFLLTETIPFQYLITAIAPDFFGNPVTRNDWFGHYAEWSSFIGIWPLLLAIYAGIRIRSRRVYFFLLLGIGALVLSVHSFISPLIVSLKIPVLSTSALSRIIILFSFAFSVLAGFGFDQMIKDIQDGKAFRKMFILFFLTGSFFIFVWCLILFSNVYPKEWLIVAKRNFVLPTILFVAGVFIIFLSSKNKKFRLLLTCFLLLAVFFDSFRFAQKWMPFGIRDFVYPDVPIASAIQKNIGYGRLLGNFGAEFATYYGFSSIEGYDPLYIGRYGEFIQSMGSGELVKGERSIVRFPRNEKYTDRVLDLLGISIIYHAISDTNLGWAYPVWRDKERNRLFYQDNKLELYQNTHALPRAVLFYNVEVIREDRKILKRFYSDEFNFKKTVILEEPIDHVLKEGIGSAKIVMYTPNKIVVEAETTEPALLFLSDNFFPNWKATVNGKPTKIYRADYTFRAVFIPAGKPVVEFIYENWNF